MKFDNKDVAKDVFGRLNTQSIPLGQPMAPEEIEAHQWRELSMRLKDRESDSRGQTMVEYALILAFISLIAVSVLGALGAKVKATYSAINNQLAVAQSAS